ncbi:MAG: hypothetical protein E7159_03185 [Firmicutes bacterium]|nr:hypothetical protein [Bacillota bacterium]
MEEKEKIEIVDSNENVIGVVEDRKKTPKIFVLVLTLIIIALVGYIGYDKLYANKVVNEDNNSSVNNVQDKPVSNENAESKRELTEEQKADMLKTVGLTENGLERLSAEAVLEAQLGEGEYTDLRGLAISFIRLGAGTYLTSDFDVNLKKEIIALSPYSNLGDLYEVENEDHYCYPGSGHCFTITEDDYKIVAKNYGFSLNPDTVFNKNNGEYDNGKYLIQTVGTFFSPNKVEDKISFGLGDKEAYINYDVKLVPVKNEYDSTIINKNITYTFKLDGNNEYNLYQIKVVNK